MHPRVIIIDDHQVLIEGLTSLLKMAEIVVVGTANNKIDAMALIEAATYDVALIDINLGGEDGLELIVPVKELDNKVIILSSYTDIRLIKKALTKGADGYLTKEAASNHVIQAISQVIKGQKFFDPIIQTRLNQSFISAVPVSKKTERVIEAHLTQREKEVLTLIAHEMTSEEIAKKLFIAKSTVDTYRKNLIEKLKVKNAVGLGIWAVNNGII